MGRIIMEAKEFKTGLIFNLCKDAPIRSVKYYVVKFGVDWNTATHVVARIKDYQYRVYHQTLKCYSYIDRQFVR